MYLRCVVVGDIATNCYLLGDEATHLAAVIDPGDQGAELCRLMRKEGYTPAMILLTHGHFDHVLGVRDFLAEAGSVPVYLSKKDYPYSPTNFHVGTHGAGLGELAEARFLSEGDEVQLGDLTVSVLETPGHTEGGLTFLVGDALFTGDTLFAGSCGRTDFVNSDVNAMFASLKRLGELEGDYTVCPGHGSCSTLERERRYNPYLRQAMGL